VQVQSYLTSALDGDELIDLHLGSLLAKKELKYALKSRLPGLQNWSGHCSEENKSLTSVSIQTTVLWLCSLSGSHL
jgi:hypothetical protein